MKPNFWTLNKLIVLIVLGALAGLLLEIRYTHREVLGAEPLSWTPLVYSGVMLFAGGLGLLLWEHGGRKTLFWGFAIGLIIGPLGLWLHTLKQPVRGLQRELSAWTQPIKSEEKHEEDAALERPPVMAPLSFFGLGLLGMVACASRFQPNAMEK